MKIDHSKQANFVQLPRNASEHQKMTDRMDKYQTPIFDDLGTIEFLNGTCIKGIVKTTGGVKDGIGRFRFKDGTQYEGEVKSNKVHGVGKFSWPHGAEYYGDTIDGLRHGYGVYTNVDQSEFYQGMWSKGKRDGLGRCTVNGNCFIGEWKSDDFEGWGIAIYESGARYEGQWKGNVPCGYGRMSWIPKTEHIVANRDVELFCNPDANKPPKQQQRSNGAPHFHETCARGRCSCLVHVQDALILWIYDGEWKAGKMHGYGTLTWQISTSKKKATLIHPERTEHMFQGSFQNGVRHGRGKLFLADGTIIESMWEKDHREGPGLLTYCNGTKENVFFVQDTLMRSDEKILQPMTNSYTANAEKEWLKCKKQTVTRLPQDVDMDFPSISVINALQDQMSADESLRVTHALRTLFCRLRPDLRILFNTYASIVQPKQLLVPYRCMNLELLGNERDIVYAALKDIPVFIQTECSLGLTMIPHYYRNYEEMHREALRNKLDRNSIEQLFTLLNKLVEASVVKAVGTYETVLKILFSNSSSSHQADRLNDPLRDAVPSKCPLDSSLDKSKSREEVKCNISDTKATGLDRMSLWQFWELLHDAQLINPQLDLITINSIAAPTLERERAMMDVFSSTSVHDGTQRFSFSAFQEILLNLLDYVTTFFPPFINECVRQKVSLDLRFDVGFEHYFSSLIAAGKNMMAHGYASDNYISNTWIAKMDRSARRHTQISGADIGKRKKKLIDLNVSDQVPKATKERAFSVNNCHTNTTPTPVLCLPKEMVSCSPPQVVHLHEYVVHDYIPSNYYKLLEQEHGCVAFHYSCVTQKKDSRGTRFTQLHEQPGEEMLCGIRYFQNLLIENEVLKRERCLLKRIEERTSQQQSVSSTEQNQSCRSDIGGFKQERSKHRQLRVIQKCSSFLGLPLPLPPRFLLRIGDIVELLNRYHHVLHKCYRKYVKFKQATNYSNVWAVSTRDEDVFEETQGDDQLSLSGFVVFLQDFQLLEEMSIPLDFILRQILWRVFEFDLDAWIHTTQQTVACQKHGYLNTHRGNATRFAVSDLKWDSKNEVSNNERRCSSPKSLSQKEKLAQIFESCAYTKAKNNKQKAARIPIKLINLQRYLPDKLGFIYEQWLQAIIVLAFMMYAPKNHNVNLSFIPSIILSLKSFLERVQNQSTCSSMT